MAWIPKVNGEEWSVRPHEHEQCGYFWVPQEESKAIIGLGNLEFDGDPENLIELAFPNMVFIGGRGKYHAVKPGDGEDEVFVAVLRFNPNLPHVFREEYVLVLGEEAEEESE